MLWLASGLGVWLVLFGDTLAQSARIAERVSAGLPASTVLDPLERSVGPSGLPPLDGAGADRVPREHEIGQDLR